MSSSPTDPSGLTPIIRGVVRKAESVYSKMGIRRDESEDLTRKKRGNGDGEAKSIPWEDTTEVSIAALRGFLEDLLGLTHSDGTQETVASIPPPQATAIEHAINPTAARAANAYQSMGRVVHDKNVVTSIPLPDIPQSTEPKNTDKTVLGDDFGEDERDRLRGYIADMAELERRGISMLTLRRSLTFLESIHQAIEDAK